MTLSHREEAVTQMSPMSQSASNINWLVNNFVDRVPGVQEAVVVSSDGLPMAMSRGLDRASGDRFAAVASGLIGLAYGAAGRFGGGAVNEVIVEMENAFIFVTGISDGSSLAVVASSECDIGLVGYEMALLVEKTGSVLTPELRAELQSALPR
jgi:predicted regulator of Ras-like GTPase activity (Roadblock/LC7/MglB family)